VTGSVVADTGPIIALAVIGKLDVLRSLFDEVFVPEAVHEEILEGGADGVGISSYVRASWLRKQTLRSPLDPLVKSVLDKGEASVIQLAREAGTDWVLIDERKARKIAREVYGLKVVGSAGIIVVAKREGIVQSVGDELNRMRDAGYWIHDDILAAAVRAAGEE